MRFDQECPSLSSREAEDTRGFRGLDLGEASSSSGCDSLQAHGCDFLRGAVQGEPNGVENRIQRGLRTKLFSFFSPRLSSLRAESEHQRTASARLCSVSVCLAASCGSRETPEVDSRQSLWSSQVKGPPLLQAVEGLCLHNMGAKLYTRLQQVRQGPLFSPVARSVRAARSAEAVRPTSTSHRKVVCVSAAVALRTFSSLLDVLEGLRRAYRRAA